MSYSYQWLDVPWGDGDMGTYVRKPLYGELVEMNDSN